MLIFQAGEEFARRDSGDGPSTSTLDVGARCSAGRTHHDRETVGPHSQCELPSLIIVNNGILLVNDK